MLEEARLPTSTEQHQESLQNYPSSELEAIFHDQFPHFNPAETATTTTPTTSPHQQNHERLGVLPLAVLVFYSVSGGPFGVESSVRSAGHLWTLLGFLFMPLVWSLPEAMMTAELGAAFPDSSGGVAWVETAFGPHVGWMAGFLGWVAGATDNAIYPVLFLEYLLQVIESKSDTEEEGDSDSSAFHPVLRFLLLSATSLTLSYVNWLGLAVVGRMSVTICIIAMSPFLLLSIIGAFQCDPSRWLELPSEDSSVLEEVTDDDVGGGIFPKMEWAGVLWRPFLNNLFWNLNSFDAAASFSADIDDPGRVLPHAMMWALVMVIAGYFVPLLIAIGASNAEQHEWVDGFLARIASEVAGPWLGAWTVFAAGISNIALFQAELSADAYQVMGMAERGYLPKFFTRRSRQGTPTYGILLCTLVLVVMGMSNLDRLIEMLNFNYAISLLLEYSAFLKLRLSRHDLHRPWRIPLGTVGCVIALIPTFAFTLLVMALADYETYLFSVGSNLVGLAAYAAKDPNSICRRKNYAPVEPVENSEHSQRDGIQMT